MDPARYGLQQRWDSNSALEGYGAAGEPNFRTSGSYNGRRLIDEGFQDDNVYPRGNAHRSIFERDAYQPPGQAVGAWTQSRRDFDEEYADFQESKRHGKAYAHSFREVDEFRGVDKYRGSYRDVDEFHDADNYHHYGFDHHYRLGGRDNEAFNDDTYEYRHRGSRYSRESSHEIDHDLGRYDFDTEYDKGRRDTGWRRRESRDNERDTRDQIYERDASPHGRWGHSRSRSRGRDDRSRSRSPRGRSHGRSRREDSYDDNRYDRIERWRDRDHDEKRHTTSVGPSATVVVKGLSQKTTEEDLYQILADWGPLRHIRVIRERNFGTSRGFAFIDFPTVGAARKMMDAIGDGLVFDGRKIFFEYSSKPTGGAGAIGHENSVKAGHFRNVMQSDWMCTICRCVNFARRTSCFQCNEGRTDDAPLADVASANLNAGKKGSDSGPSHVLVVRGLDENADDEMLRYEFSKHAPIKDIRLVRDKFTHVSRGFAFVHFHSVEDATKALEETNGTKLEKNGQILRVAYAKSVHGPGASGSSQSSSLAAAAIEAAAFSQQYDAVGWAPKEYNSDDKQVTGPDEKPNVVNQEGGSAVQSGFVWDEASGYYYDSASGFYYDGNTGLYYDSNSGTWFSYDHQTQQYVPCTDQNNNGESSKSENRAAKSSEPAKKKAVISAPAAMTSKEKVSLPDSIQAAAAAALAAEKKEKEKIKDIKLASKSSISANKKKMSNVLTMWKQRNHEGQAARVVLDDKEASGTEDRPSGLSAKTKSKHEALGPKEGTVSLGFSSSNAGQMTSSGSLTSATQSITDSQITPKPVGNSSGGSIMGVIRSSGRGVVKSDTKFSGFSSGETTANNSSSPPSTSGTSVSISGATSAAMPFRTDSAALGSYAPSATTGKRRFSEMPLQPSSREQPQVVYRDRAAERRSLYGSSSIGDTPDLGMGDSNHDFSYRKSSSSDIGAMPFPPGVGGGYVGSDTQRYEAVPADRAIGENNVGNRMLRNMGWQEGSGLGRDGSGITEPVQALGMDDRAGLGRHQRKIDPDLEVHAGDSYRTLIQKKAIARFREMSQ